MNKILFLLLTLSILSCSSQGVINIPDKVKVEDLNSKQRIGNTRILIAENSDYQFIPDAMRLQKNQNQYIQIVEVPNRSYYSVVPPFLNKLSGIEGQGGNIRLKKEFKLGEFDAFLVIELQDTEEQITLVFGDETFCTLLIGVFPNNETDRKEIVDYILTAYLDKRIEVDWQKQLNFNLSLENTNYKLLTVNGGVAQYTENGATLSNDWQKNGFIVGVLPKPSGIDLKQYSDKTIQRFEQNNFEEKRMHIEILKENRLDAKTIEVEMKGKTINKDLLLYQKMKLTPNDVVIQFLGFAFDNKEKQIEIFKNIAKTIKKK